MIKLLFFARLREELDASEESLTLPANISTVGDLRDHLCERGEQWLTALHTPGLFVAVQQEVVRWDTALAGDEEVAFFPPVTGG